MKGIQLDHQSCVARAQAGLTWGEFDRATQTCGLATTGGIVSRTGIAGLTLGGGIGWLMRKHGLTCDNLLSAEIVTAGGRLLTVNEGENSDLFWGLRGGGGNFGIVTSFEYRLHSVGPVLAGIIIYSAERAAELLRFYRDYITAAPDELTSMFLFLRAQRAPDLPEGIFGKPAIAVHVCYAGPVEEGQKVLRPLREVCTPLSDSVGVMSYVGLQSMLDSNSPPGLQNFWKSAYLSSLSDACIDVIVDYASRMTSSLTQVHLQHMQGVVNRIDEETMSLSHRNALVVLNIVSKWTDPAESDKHMRWTRAFAEAMSPFSVGVYVNFLGDEGEDRVRAAYRPDKYERLVALKKLYDPENFFQLNQNIRPSGTRRGPRFLP
jgi:FAD/FMN-containing dehydrogenase